MAHGSTDPSRDRPALDHGIGVRLGQGIPGHLGRAAPDSLE